MSLFIAGLAFDDAARLDAAKIAVLASSIIAGAIGYTILRRSPVSSANMDGDEEGDTLAEMDGELLEPAADVGR
jgi:hypothetical protein